MTTYYFSFGCDHTPFNGATIQPIEASDFNTANLIMHAVWGTRWAFPYTTFEEVESWAETYLPTIDSLNFLRHTRRILNSPESFPLNNPDKEPSC